MAKSQGYFSPFMSEIQGYLEDLMSKYQGYFDIHFVKITDYYPEQYKGYELLNIVQMDRIEYQSVTKHYQDSNNYVNSYCDSIPVNMSESYVVLGRKEDALIREADKRVCEAEQKHRKTEDVVVEYKKVIERMAEEIKNLTATLHLREIQEVGRVKTIDELRDKVRKYENDLAAIRTAIGELKIKEILNDTK